MSGNARGQLKEEMEGIARNLTWVQQHCEKALDIIADKNPTLTNMFQGLHSTIGTLSETLQGVYTTL